MYGSLFLYVSALSYFSGRFDPENICQGANICREALKFFFLNAAAKKEKP
jgi:hypothetical protein